MANRKNLAFWSVAVADRIFMNQDCQNGGTTSYHPFLLFSILVLGYPNDHIQKWDDIGDPFLWISVIIQFWFFHSKAATKWKNKTNSIVIGTQLIYRTLQVNKSIHPQSLRHLARPSAGISHRAQALTTSRRNAGTPRKWFNGDFSWFNGI